MLPKSRLCSGQDGACEPRGAWVKTIPVRRAAHFFLEGSDMRETDRQIHLAEDGSMHTLCGIHTGGTLRVERVIAAHDRTCDACLARREIMRDRGVSMMLTGLLECRA